MRLRKEAGVDKTEFGFENGSKVFQKAGSDVLSDEVSISRLEVGFRAICEEYISWNLWEEGMFLALFT